jgi:uncharacterized damage-inducible protein DinB
MPNNSLQQMLLAEFDREMATTRKILARVPFDKFNWAPHKKSALLGKLAVHVATLPGLGADIIEKEELTFNGSYTPPVFNSTEELVAFFDKNAHATHLALEKTTDEKLLKSWRLAFGDMEIFNGPRAMAFHIVMLNHHIHHRAQLGVYLRLNDIPLPGSYGPSADEKGM